jgi:hypothetical protein
MAGESVLRRLFVEVGLVTDEKSFDAFEANVGRVKAGLEEIGKIGLAIGAAVAAAGVGIVSETSRVAAHSQAVVRNAAALGLTTDAYQELGYAIESTGGDVDDLGDLFGQLSDYALEAVKGSESQAEAFALLGLSADDLRGKRPEELFDLVSDGIKKTTDPTKRLAAASRLLGDDVAKKMLPLLMRGSAGIGELRREAHQLGRVLDDEAIAQSAAFAQESRELTGTLQGLRDQFAVALLPAVTRVARAMGDFLDRNRAGTKALVDFTARWGMWILGALAAVGALASLAIGIGGVVVVGGSLVTLLTGLASAFSILAPAVTTIGGAVLAFVGIFTTAFAAGGAWFVLFDALVLAIPVTLALLAALQTIMIVLGVIVGPLLAAAAGVTTLYLVLEDLFMFLQGGNKTAIGAFVDSWVEADGALGEVARTVVSLRNFILALGAALAPVVVGLGALASDGFAALTSAGRDLLDTVLKPIETTLSAVVGHLTQFADMSANATLPGVRGVIDGLTGQLAGGAIGFAPTSAPTTGGSSSTSYSSADNVTIQIDGSGDPQATAAMVDEKLAARRRAAFDAHRGGDR